MSTFRETARKPQCFSFGVYGLTAVLGGDAMLGNKLNKSIADVAWSQLAQFTAYKAEDAGRLFLQVDPRNTSKMCSRCGSIVPKDLSVRIHDCPHCGLVLDRDHNAAINILALGLQRINAGLPDEVVEAQRL